MVEADQRFRPNTPDVAAKVIDGEAILINLGSGLYYTLDQVGGTVWSEIEKGRSAFEIASTLTAHYEVPLKQALTDSERIIGELVTEQLVVEALAEQVDSDGASMTDTGEKQPYVAPRLTRFDDMAEVFALDPPLPKLPEVGEE